MEYLTRKKTVHTINLNTEKQLAIRPVKTNMGGEFAEQIPSIEETLGEAVYEESVIRAEPDWSVIDAEM